jgi:flagellar basal-body rod modification protein FlgD
MDNAITNFSNQALIGSETKEQGARPPAAQDPLSGKEAFLQLLVAQIKNQNPLNPADGVEFLTQLAQFSSLEQMMGIRQELEEIREAVTEPAPQV